jgi:Cyclic nucleotide-binding domain
MPTHYPRIEHLPATLRECGDACLRLRRRSLRREFIVIVDGKAEVTRDGTQIAVLGSGSFFGEMSLLDHQPRTRDRHDGRTDTNTRDDVDSVQQRRRDDAVG